MFRPCQIAASDQNLFETPADVLIVPLGAGDRFQSTITQLDEKLGGRLRNAIDAKEISSDANEITEWIYPPGLPVKRLIFVGCGNDLSAPTLQHAVGTAMRAAAKRKAQSVSIAPFPLSDDAAGREAFALAAATAPISQGLFRDRKEQPAALPTVTLFGIDDQTVAAATVLADAVATTRHLINQPANYIYPETFVEQASERLKPLGIELEIWDQAKLEQEKCGALLGVAAGSERPPRLMICRYRGSQAGPPVALVGKGVTFDSGGLSLKPTDAMLTMKCDMSGAATVVGVLEAAAKLKLAQGIVGVIGLVENMISGRSFKLGDVLTARSGTTIEIHNTDAEGRLVLADAIDIARDSSPSALIDFATLTGAAVVALGTDIGGLMGNDEQLAASLASAAAECGEWVWQLPMHRHFDKQIEGKVADIKNVGEGRYGGAITAAKFLERFVQNTPWAHIDLAGPAFDDKGKPYRDAGGTGYFVHTMVQWLRGRS